MAVKNEDLRLRIIIEGEGGVKKMNDAMKLTNMTMSELQKHAKLTRTALSKAVPGTEQFKQLQQELARTDARLKELRGGSANTSSAVMSMAKGFTIAGVALKAVSGIADGFKKAFDTAKNATQAFGDYFGRETAAIKAGWEQLIANMSAAPGTITKSVRDAVNGAREAFDLRDELFERGNSAQIISEKERQEILQLEAIAADSSNSAQERLQALDKAMEKEKELAAMKKSIAEQELKAAQIELEARTSLTAEQQKQVIDLYEKNRVNFQLAIEYNNLIARRNKIILNRQTIEQQMAEGSVYGKDELIRLGQELDTVTRKLGTYSNAVIQNASIIRQYNLSNDEMVKAYVDARVKVEQADTTLAAAEKSQARRRGALNRQIAAEGKAAADKAYNDAISKAKKTAQEELNTLKTKLLSEQMTQEEYNAQAAAIEEKSQQEIIRIKKKYKKDASADEGQLLDKQLKQKAETEKSREAALAFQQSMEDDKVAIATNAENKRYQDEIKAFEKHKSLLENAAEVKEEIERRHQEKLAGIKQAAAAESLNVEKSKHELELQQIRTRYAQELSMTKSRSEITRLRKAMEKEIAESNIAFLKSNIQALEQMVSQSSGMTEQELLALKTQLSKAYNDLVMLETSLNKGSGLNAASGTGDGSLFGVSQQAWEQLFSNLRQGKMSAQDLVSVIDGIGQAAQEGLKLATLSINLMNAEENKAFEQYEKNNEKKKTDLQRRLDAGLIAQSEYDSESEKLQKEADQKKEAMEHEQAERQKKMSIAQAIIQTALSVAKTFSQWGFPFGLIPAGIMAALGAAQVALIAATPAYAQGGYVDSTGKTYNAKLDPNKRGYVSRPTVLVGEEGGEYVIPSSGIKNPTLAPLLASIESARKAGTLRNIDFGAVYPSAYAKGGATVNDTYPQINVPMDDMVALLKAIRDKMEEPTPAVVSMLGKNGIKEAMDNYDRYKSRGRI